MDHPLGSNYLKIRYLNISEQIIDWVGSPFKVWIKKEWKILNFCKFSKKTFYGLGHPLGLEYLKGKGLLAFLNETQKQILLGLDHHLKFGYLKEQGNSVKTQKVYASWPPVRT